jgi:hypothetical protein
MAVHALLKFHEATLPSTGTSSSDGSSNDSTTTTPIQVNSQLFSSIFQADEKMLVFDHITEFWY